MATEKTIMPITETNNTSTTTNTTANTGAGNTASANTSTTTSANAGTTGTTATTTPTTTPTTGTTTTDTAATTNTVTSDAYTTARTNAINAMYAAQQAQQEAQLKQAYEQNLSSYQAAQDKISPQYQQQANDLAIQYERNARNFNQQAAATGINSGVGSQAALARAGEYQRDYASLRTSEAEQQAEAERQKALLEAQYKNDVAAALAENDYSKAQALLDEYENGYNRDVQNAQILASYGDFSGYATLYGQEQADAMWRLWVAQNPDLAKQTGSITEAQYNNLKAGNEMNKGLDENGNVPTSTSTANTGASTYVDYYSSPFANTSSNKTTSSTSGSNNSGSSTYQTLLDAYRSYDGNSKTGSTLTSLSNLQSEALAAGKITAAESANLTGELYNARYRASR